MRVKTFPYLPPRTKKRFLNYKKPIKNVTEMQVFLYQEKHDL